MENYVVHFFLGKAEEEELKLCRWPQWQQCVTIFDEILAPYAKTAYITTDQVYNIFLKPHKNDDPRTRRVTCKKVTGLSGLKWNVQCNELWSKSLDTTEPHPTELFGTAIYSSKQNSKKGTTPDICILIGDQQPLKNVLGECIKDKYVYNQSLTLSIKEKVYASRPASDWDSLIEKLSKLMAAVRVGRTVRPWVMSETTIDPPGSGIQSITSSCLGYGSFVENCKSLDFNTYFQEWEYLDIDKLKPA